MFNWPSTLPETVPLPSIVRLVVVPLTVINWPLTVPVAVPEPFSVRAQSIAGDQSIGRPSLNRGQFRGFAGSGLERAASGL